MAAEEVEKLDNKSPSPSLTVPSVSQSFHEVRDTPLLSIDYIHNSPANTNMNFLANNGKNIMAVVGLKTIFYLCIYFKR